MPEANVGILISTNKILCNSQRESLFQFVVALKACPVHFTVHRVEFWGERAAKKGQTSFNPLQLTSETNH